MFCKVCGKEINDKAVVCPHCGCSQKEDDAKQVEKKTNGLSIAGFVVSIVSYFISLFCIVPVVGLVLSCLGSSKAKANNEKQGLAIAGIVLGIIATVLNALFLILGVSFLI